MRGTNEHIRKHHVWHFQPWQRQSAADINWKRRSQPDIGKFKYCGCELGSGAPSQVDVEAVLSKLASQNKEKLDWRKSIVDLMKLLNLDSSLSARKELAKELHYTGDMANSADMNIWLHKQVMIKLAENGGKVPDSLRV
jgi:hypothetical protein